MAAPLNIVFLGSDPIALPLLEWLADGGQALGRVTAVFTQPDRPVGRGQKVVANGIKTWAIARGLPVYQPEKLTEDVRGQLAALSPDVALVMAYGHILRQDFIDTPRLGTLNLHASLLPKYRGASPIQTAIANGESETGVSLMRIVRQLDAGPVADAERVPIASLDTALDIEGKLAVACVPLLARTLPRLAAGQLAFVEQDPASATFCRRLVKDDGRLDFSASAAALAARINGLFPWPACSVEIAGQPVKIGLADAPTEDTGHVIGDQPSGREVPAGTVLGADSEGLRVATGHGVLRLLRLQRPGGRLLAAGEFLRGFPIAAGTRLPSFPLAPLVAREPFRK
ncbi:MAG: methionyl-tRNA formyltransferase [Verrucomicrobia bacterium]|nr:methionyl-tRNA formyltransferase [Verrucomicrobiota bacterium]